MGGMMSTTEKKPTGAEASAEDANRVKLPGFGLPRDAGWYDSDKRFPHALEGEGRGALSKGVFLRERRMLEFMNSITDKPEWERKVFDEEIVGKWRNECKEKPNVEHDDVFMSEAMFDNVRTDPT